MDYYAGMLKRFAPPGVVNFNWYECSSAFMQDQVAQYFDGVNFASQFEDKEKSKVAGKVGYAVLPAGPGGHFSPIFGNAVAVSSQSKVPGPAYFFAQWATSKQSAVKELLAGTGSARTSVWNDPEVKAKAKMPADWSQAYVDSLKIGRLGLPEIVAVTEYRDIIGVAIQKAIEGAKSADVLAPGPEGVPGGPGQDREVAAGDRAARGARMTGRPGRAGGGVAAPIRLTRHGSEEVAMKKGTRQTVGSRGMTRRDVLRLGATVAAGAAVGPFVHTPGHGQTFNWQRFKGKELFLLLYKHPWVDEMVKHIPEFESLTGIKVEVRGAARGAGPAEVHGGDDRRLRRGRRLARQHARGEAPGLEVGLVPAAERASWRTRA